MWTANLCTEECKGKNSCITPTTGVIATTTFDLPRPKKEQNKIQLPHTSEASGWPMSKGKRANQLWNRVAVPRRVCETKGKLKHCLRVASFSPHSSISRLATMSLYESYSLSRIRHTSLQWYVFLWTTLASCVPVPTGAKPQSNYWEKHMSGYLYPS